MGRRKKSEVSVQALETKETELATVKMNAVALQDQYIAELDNNPLYSLEVDPEHHYDMTDQQKLFVKQYVEYKSVGIAAELVGIDKDTAMAYFASYASQEEIRRINRALYHRQFKSKLLSLDEIGGYLSSLITDDFVPKADQLSTKDKLHVVQMLIDLNKLKASAFSDPTLLMAKDIDIQIKSLSVATIQQLLTQSNKPPQATAYSDADGVALSPEENAYLSTLPTKDILHLLDETNKHEGGQQNDVQ